MRIGLPDDIFQVGALSLAKFHLHDGSSIQDFAIKIWDGYRKQVEDPKAIGDMVAAASEIVRYLKERNHEFPVAVVRCAQYFCMNFDDEGNKRKKGLLGGLWFSSTPTSVDRVAKLIRKFKIYQVAADSGLDIPMPPDEWRL
jgi:hypothetical protein